MNVSGLGFEGTPRVHVSNIWVLRVLVTVITVQLLGKYNLIKYLDP